MKLYSISFQINADQSQRVHELDSSSALLLRHDQHHQGDKVRRDSESVA